MLKLHLTRKDMMARTNKIHRLFVRSKVQCNLLNNYSKVNIVKHNQVRFNYYVRCYSIVKMY